MQGRAAVVAIAVAALGLGVAGCTVLAPALASANDPSDPLRSHIQHRYPKAQAVFANCPGNNRVPFGGGEGLACEFRFILHNGVIKGGALAVPDDERWAVATWSVRRFHADTRQPQRWERCRTPGVGASYPVRLSAFGVPCHEARFLAAQIGARAASAANLRIPKRFTEGPYGTFTLGFLATRYHCTGRVEVRRGSPNPYGHETAACRTRFGDRLVYVFDQGS